jgi:hypothetical protein
MNKKDAKPGYITVISVIIIGAIVTAIAVSLLNNGIDASRNSLSRIGLAQARALADACAEEALQKIRDSSYTGSFNLSFAAGRCDRLIDKCRQEDARYGRSSQSEDSLELMDGARRFLKSINKRKELCYHISRFI